MRRPQFGIHTALWLTAVVAAFFAGRQSGWQGHRQRIESLEMRASKGHSHGTPARLEKLLEAAARNRDLQLARASNKDRPAKVKNWPL